MQSLTTTRTAAKIDPHSQNVGVGIGTPEITGQKAANHSAVFYCPSKMQAGFIRLKSVMVGCIGQASAWPVPVSGSSNPVQPASQRLEPMRGGYILNTGDTAMANHATNPSEIQDTKPQIQYTQTGSTRRMTATGVSIAQALALWNAFKVVGGAA